MTVRNVGVVGSGTMGSGIAQVVAQSGFQVQLFDIGQDILDQSLARIFKHIERLLEKGRISETDCGQAKERITTTTKLSDFKDCQLVIEAAPEKMEVKQEIFRELDQSCGSETILATNTSSFSITQIASYTNQPYRVAGMHFFNPAPLMPLVELIRGVQTSREMIDALVQFAVDLNKDPVICEDTAGFIVNRVARPFYNEALWITGDQVASFEQVDRIMKLAGNFRMGPFELQDLIGIDINYSTTESVYAGFYAEPRFRPHPYQRKMVQSGKIGRKAGRGYFEYEQ